MKQNHVTHTVGTVWSRNLKIYLFSSQNVHIIDATVLRLRLGSTLCPASLMERPCFITWSTRVALMSSDTRLYTGLRLYPLPRLTPLSLCPPLTLNLIACLHACKVFKMAYLRPICNAKAQTDWCSVFMQVFSGVYVSAYNCQMSFAF